MKKRTVEEPLAFALADLTTLVGELWGHVRDAALASTEDGYRRSAARLRCGLIEVRMRIDKLLLRWPD